MTSHKRFVELTEEALSHTMKGWDFSFVEGRIEEAGLSWDYRALIEARLQRAQALLDISTGGGEFLDRFRHLPKFTLATESYAPNVKLAKDRLSPRGVEVVSTENDARFPLPDDTFDLIACRHGAYRPEELARIAHPDGSRFITQQVGSDNLIELNNILDSSLPTSTWNLDIASEQLDAEGFAIETACEEHPITRFHDIGAVTFYLKAVPWQIPDFEFEAYRSRLLDLHERIEADGPFKVAAHRFLIEARLPRRQPGRQMRRQP